MFGLSFNSHGGGLRLKLAAVVLVGCAPLAVSAQEQKPDQKIVIAFNGGDGRIVVNVEVDGTPIDAVIDTASTVSWVNGKATHVRAPDNAPVVPLNTAGGQHLVPLGYANFCFYTSPLEKQCFKIGQIAIERGKVADLFDAVLGYDFLRHFKSFTVDYSRHVVELEK
jgi:hypothetical protein